MRRSASRFLTERIVVIRPLVSVLLLAVIAFELGTVARADESYRVSGRDSFSIGENGISSEVAYAGMQTLGVVRREHATRYVAHVTYERRDGGASTRAVADYVSDVSATGAPIDAANHDPDYLTVLNQPFAAKLDAGTLGDLRALRGSVPFDFPSPFSSASLHGYLRHVPSGMVGPRRSIGVTFEAAGAMRGALPDRPELLLRGTIAMHGTAFYDARTALMVSLETTVTISGNVSNRAGKEPVTITFERSLRAVR